MHKQLRSRKERDYDAEEQERRLDEQQSALSEQAKVEKALRKDVQNLVAKMKKMHAQVRCDGELSSGLFL